MPPSESNLTLTARKRCSATQANPDRPAETGWVDHASTLGDLHPSGGRKSPGGLAGALHERSPRRTAHLRGRL